MADLSLAGKHRGIVESNNDPLKLGRLKVRLEAAYGQQPVPDLPWAWPCFAYGGMPQMALYAVPEEGAGVWIEFQWKDGQPDPTHPVWTGIWIAEGETPVEVEGPAEEAHYYKVFKTTSGHCMVFCDKPGREFIKFQHGPTGSWRIFTPEGDILDKSARHINHNPRLISSLVQGIICPGSEATAPTSLEIGSKYGTVM